MQEIFQNTINKSVIFEGIGLHSGKNSRVKLIPSEDNQGIIFKRTDLKTNNIIKADYKNVSTAMLCTTLQNSSGCKISTVEHLLAALYILGIDNLVVEVNNEEIPIMDGSSKDFIKILNTIGIKKLNAKRKYLKILKKIELEDSDRTISIEPSNLNFEVKFQLNYENNIIGKQKNTIDFTNDNLEDVYSSRTFCLFKDIEKIKKNGLAKGGSLSNAVVVKDEEILNDEGLRNKKEFVNHKILDLAGDFMLSGYRILGSVKCVQGGHLLSNRFIRKIFEDSSNYELSSLNNIEIIKNNFKNPINKLAVNA